MPSASLIKVLVSVALWEAVAAGSIDPDRRVPAGDIWLDDPAALVSGLDPATELTPADLDLLMLSVSDNAATNAIIDMVGMGPVNAVGERLGLTATTLGRHMLDFAAAEAGRDNVTSAGDMGRLMAAVGGAGGIDPEVCSHVTAGLLRSQHHEIVPRYLPADITAIAPKLGQIPAVLHAAALVDRGDRRTALVVMSHPAAAPDGLARVAGAAYHALSAH